MKHARRRSLVVPLVAGVLATSGAIAIAVAIAGQDDAPQPPRSAAGSLERNAETAATSVARSSPKPAPELALPSSKPVAIDIPAIGVHSVIQYVGLTPEHTLQVPAPGPHYNEAAWYKYSSTPGSTGPAVIVGHVDSAAEGPSVFFDLGDLRPEDKVLVTRADGLVAVFTVDGVRSFPKDDFPTELVYGKNQHAVLRLVTCGGPFDDSTGHYLDNIVVFASFVGSH
ncbi:MAG: class F sortase [Actinomycetota bacterium]